VGLMGWIMHWQGNREKAAPLLEQALALARGSGDERTVARLLLVLGDLRMRLKALQAADALLRESLGMYQRMGDAWSTAWALGALGDVARLQGDFRGAAAHLHLSLAIYKDLGSKPEIPYVLEALALVASDQGQFQNSAYLWGAASAVRDSIRAVLPPAYQADYAPHLDKVRIALGREAFAAAWAEGRAATVDQALATAEAELEALPDAVLGPVLPVAHAPSPAHQYGLTSREVEVLRLVARGLTDAQIGERLVISPRTVSKHLQSVYSKLDLQSRSAATRWAIDHRLA
jgi:DNA-binding CsgD family transcriptional regulator